VSKYLHLLEKRRKYIEKYHNAQMEMNYAKDMGKMKEYMKYKNLVTKYEEKLANIYMALRVEADKLRVRESWD
jgi:hypothetical protein